MKIPKKKSKKELEAERKKMEADRKKLEAEKKYRAFEYLAENQRHARFTNASEPQE